MLIAYKCTDLPMTKILSYINKIIRNVPIQLHFNQSTYSRGRHGLNSVVRVRVEVSICCVEFLSRNTVMKLLLGFVRSLSSLDTK